MTTITGTSKNDIEKWLEDKLVKFVFDPKFQTVNIDEQASLKNQARFEPLHPENVARYAEAMARGDQFPPLVIHQLENGLYRVDDGNHRYQAYKRNNIDHIPVYVLHPDTTDETIRVITFEANARHGEPPSDEERRRHAIYLVDNGMTNVTAASIVNLPVSSVNRAVSHERADRRARSLGLSKQWARLLIDQRQVIMPISNDPTFIELVKFAADTGINATQTREYVTQVKELRSERAQIQAIKEARETLRTEAQTTVGGRIRANNPRQNLLRHIGAVLLMDPDAICNACASKEQAEVMKMRVWDAIGILDKLSDQLSEMIDG
jgi:ParB-like chromosome segregation protein Spo0J